MAASEASILMGLLGGVQSLRTPPRRQRSNVAETPEKVDPDADPKAVFVTGWESESFESVLHSL